MHTIHFLANMWLLFRQPIQALKPYEITLNATHLEDSATYTYSSGYESNRFELFLADASLLDASNFFIVLESQNPDFSVALFDDPLSSAKSSTPVLEFKTNTGNLVFGINANYFSSKLENFHVSGVLRLAIIARESAAADETYFLRFSVAKELSLTPGKAFTCHFDPTMVSLPVNFLYSGSQFNALQKIRIQLTVVQRKGDFMLTADLEHAGAVYELNGLFGHVVAGVLSHPYHAICREESCSCKLRIKMLRIKTLNIESAFVEEIEQLSLTHFEEYYGRSYDENSKQLYELPFDPRAAGLDVTFSLVTVSGISGLYVNARTLPKSLEKYDWKEIGQLAKRLTVKNEDLSLMKAENSTLFLAVTTSKPGEFLLRVDAHARNFRGRLFPGVVESGSLSEEALVNFIYFFEAFETQEVKFEVSLNLLSGDAELFLKACKSSENCKLSDEETKMSQSEGIFKAISALSEKRLSYSGKCRVAKNRGPKKCAFVLALRARGNKNALFELSLAEGQFHRLLQPGRETRLNLKADQRAFLKFSNSPNRTGSTRLFFQISPVYGSFSVFLDKSSKFPSQTSSLISRTIKASKAGLYNSMETIEITEDLTDDQSIFGAYYVGIQAESACSLALKFFSKSEQGVALHSLLPGSELRGQISSLEEIAYYIVKLAPETNSENRKIVFLLTPLKGNYLLFLNKDGSLPTRKSHFVASQDHHLEFEPLSENTSSPLELVLGVQLSSPALGQGLSKRRQRQLRDGDFQFYISCSHSSRPLKLTTGVISGHLLRQQNLFAIEILAEMAHLLIVKGVSDGLNVQVCYQFASSEAWAGEQADCRPDITSRQTSAYLSQSQLLDGCQPFRSSDKEAPCFLLLELSGSQNQKVQLGFTYNNHPFKLTKNQLFTLPIVRRVDSQIKMIFHAEQDKPIGILFNAKGHDLAVYSKLIREDHFQDQEHLRFPDKEAFDSDKQMQRGQTIQIFYPGSEVADFGRSPEVLLTIVNTNGSAEGAAFDSNFYFTIQTTTETKELLRTQMLVDYVDEDQWNYYTFFNNGNSESVRVYVCSTLATILEVLLSKGYQSRPPFTNSPLISRKSIGTAELQLTPEDLQGQGQPGDSSSNLRGYFTLAVKSSAKTTLNLFWNNKADLNYIELLPNIPTTVSLDKEKNLYFSFYARKPERAPDWPNARVSFYLKTDVRANFYLLHSSGELTAPSSENHKWKAALGPSGGVTSLRVGAKDPDFCTNCLYIAYLDSAESGQASVLASFNYSEEPIELTPGFTFPEELAPNEKVLFRLFNADNDLLDLTAIMLNGFVDVYVSEQASVSAKEFRERYSLGETLESQKMIIIAPFRFNITGPHDFFLLVHNPKLAPAAFTLSVDKNSLRRPIEPGISKLLRLAPGEATDLFYTPRVEETLFEVRLELRQVLREEVRQQALDLLADYLELCHIDPNTNARYKLSILNKEIDRNRIFVSFDIKDSPAATFFLRVYNPVGSSVQLTVDLLNGGYHLLAYNEFRTEFLLPGKRFIYEGFGEPAKLFLVDLRSCKGEVKVEFFQGDYESVARNRSAEFKEIRNDNNVINYITLNGTRAFVRVTNNGTEPSAFQLGVFAEPDLRQNPYSELAQGNGGKVEIDTERHRFLVPAAKIKAEAMQGFRHRLTYRLFLGGDLALMRYAKNCGDLFIGKMFDQPFLISRAINFTFGSLAELDKFNSTVIFELEDFPAKSRLFGVVVATVELLPLDESFFSPLRVGKVYYDEFIYKTPLINFPAKLVMASLLILGFFAMLVILIKSCAFGEFKTVEFLKSPELLFRNPEISLEMNLRSILETEYYEGKRAGEDRPREVEMTEQRKDSEENETSLKTIRI